MSAEFFPTHEPSIEQKQPTNTPEYESEDEELEAALGNIWEIAEEFHLDPYPTHFEIVPAKIINQIGAYGIPGRFSHWTYGRAYRQMKTQYDYGLSKIYELVINSNPSEAFLLENNPPIENKFVMAHVLGHTDFFKNNRLFTSTRKDMPEAAARSAARIHEYEAKEGRLTVERFLDAALSIQEHVDPYLPQRPSREEEFKLWREQAEHDVKTAEPRVPDEFDDLFNLGARSETIEERPKATFHVPPAPDPDLLGFIRNHAPYLENWQRDVLDIVRSESIYFYPQRRTKIMNEGWAAYWHKRIMREMGERNLISDEDNEAWWRVHSGVVAENPRSLNPYYLGMKIYEYLEDYYNGNLTDEENAWLEQENIPVQPHYEGRLEDSPASAMLRDVMIHNDDQSFVRNHFNKIVSDRMNLYVYEERQMFHFGKVTVVKSTGWQDIREQLVNSLDNSGTPYIVVVDGDYHKANELYLRHEFEGKTLDPAYVEKTLPYIYSLWQRPLHLETVDSSDKKVVYSYDGTSVSKKTEA
jgi:stage V sporulation protein R